MPVLLQDYGVSLADMQDQGVVMQFQYPDKITGGTCYPMVTMDMSKFGKDNVQIATVHYDRHLRISKMIPKMEEKKG